MREQTIDELCSMLRPVIGRKNAEAIRTKYYLQRDQKRRDQFMCKVEALYAAKVKKSFDKEILLPPPTRKECQGEINIGRTEYLEKSYDDFYLNLKDLNRHAAFIGSTGSGKTTAAVRVIRELHSRNIPVLILDWEKNYRGLTKMYSDFVVFTVGIDISPFHHNPLETPPGITDEEFTKSLVSILSYDYLGGYGSDTIMLQKLVAVYQEKEVPTFSDLAQIVDEEIIRVIQGKGKLSGRSGLWQETVMRMIVWLRVGYTLPILFSKKHLPIELLLQKNTVFELGAIQSKRDRALICHFLLNQLFLFVKHRGITHENLRFVIVMEEAHNLFAIDEKMRDEPLELVHNMFKEIRKYGVGLVVIDQEPSRIPNSIFTNINTKIGFVQNTSLDNVAVARAMNLEEDWFDYLGRLMTGQAIVSVKQRLTDPFVIRTHYDQELPNVSDEELSAMMHKYSGLSKEISSGDALFTDSHGYQQRESPPLSEKLSGKEESLLRNIVDRPFDGVDVRTKMLGLHQTEMTKLHTDFTKRGALIPLSVDGKKLFELTHFGRDLAVRAGISIKKGLVRGGVAHGYSVNKVAEHLTNLGLSPKTEVDNIDIVDKRSGVAVEVETGKSNIYTNLRKLATTKYIYRFILGVDKDAELAIRKIVKSESGITIMTVREFVKLSLEQIITPSHQSNLS